MRTVALAARKLLLTELRGAEETVDHAAPVVAYGYGPGYRDLVCTLILSKSGVKLGINQGSQFDDPHHLLEGAGKVHRYIRLEAPADLRRAGVKRLINAADAARVERQRRPTRRPTR